MMKGQAHLCLPVGSRCQWQENWALNQGFSSRQHMLGRSEHSDWNHIIRSKGFHNHPKCGRYQKGGSGVKINYYLGNVQWDTLILPSRWGEESQSAEAEAGFQSEYSSALHDNSSQRKKTLEIRQDSSCK